MFIHIYIYVYIYMSLSLHLLPLPSNKGKIMILLFCTAPFVIRQLVALNSRVRSPASPRSSTAKAMAVYRGQFWKEMALLSGRESSEAQSIYIYININDHLYIWTYIYIYTYIYICVHIHAYTCLLGRSRDLTGAEDFPAQSGSDCVGKVLCPL